MLQDAMVSGNQNIANDFVTVELPTNFKLKRKKDNLLIYSSNTIDE